MASKILHFKHHNAIIVSKYFYSKFITNRKEISTRKKKHVKITGRSNPSLNGHDVQPITHMCPHHAHPLTHTHTHLPPCQKILSENCSKCKLKWPFSNSKHLPSFFKQLALPSPTSIFHKFPPLPNKNKKNYAQQNSKQISKTNKLSTTTKPSIRINTKGQQPWKTKTDT